MPTDDRSDPQPGDTQPLGFSIDIGEILRSATAPRPRRRPTRRTTGASGSGDMDAAVRRAVRAELKDVAKALKILAEEVVRLRRANEDLGDKLDRLDRR